MRLPVSRNHGHPRHFGLLLLATVMSLAGLLAAPLLARQPAAPASAPTGPAGDYPMVLGAPYVIDGATYTPADIMNVDQVGYAVIAPDAGPGVTIAHRTLPLPSYVEVTSLKTGRTILARVERRGPMSGPDLIALSSGAAAQLGADGRLPVRVRRVNPPETERALLRTGQTAPVRMDTPMSLVNVLLRKLDPALVTPPVLPAPPAPPAPEPATTDVARKAPIPPAAPKLAGKAAAAPARPAAAAARAGAAVPKPSPAATAARSGLVYVQVGAFSTRERAETAARQVGGTVSPVGKLFRVRISGFASPAAAAAALAKAKGAGYSDARIQRAD
ncbi:MAG TPA: SPOR domain-containing protein [Novosphingobium sp.]|nr:SPOR domain-containing protein [Novosphingobium sp.]